MNWMLGDILSKGLLNSWYPFSELVYFMKDE
jgi:hypothetical protein